MWDQSGLERYYFGAVALFAVGLGNHTTIVGFVPGLALFAVLTHRAFVLRRRTVALTATILCAGLFQYGFILLRSQQPGAYLESRATTLRQLIGVMMGKQFKDRLFAFGWRTVIFDRLPAIVERVLVPELTLPGLLLAAVGATWLLRRRVHEALLLLIGGGAIIAFALNYSVVDTPVFLIPALLILWILVAAGADQVVHLLTRSRRTAAVLALPLLALPAWLLAHNFSDSDRSRDTKAAVYFEGLFEALPARAALVAEDFLVDRMVTFKLLGEEAGRGRHIEIAAPDANVLRQRLDSGIGVFGFPKAARRLRYDALNFSFGPLTLLEGGLSEFLAQLPDETVVAIAVPARYTERFAAIGAIAFTAIGGPGTVPTPRPSNLAVVGVRGRRDGALVEVSPWDIRLEVPSTKHAGASRVTVPVPFEIHSTADEASIRQGSRDIVRTFEGVAVAAWSPDGRLLRSAVLQASDDFRVPVPSGPLAVYPLRGVLPRQDIGDREWANVVSMLRTGTGMVRVPAGASTVLYVSDDGRLVPRVIDKSSEQVRVDISRFEDAVSDALRTRLETESAGDISLDRDGNVYRIEVTPTGAEPVSVLLALGGCPSHASGRTTRSGTASIFSVDTEGLLRTPDRASEVLLMARDEQAQLTGFGWSTVDFDAVSAYRWMTATEARLVLPIARHRPRRIRVQALREADGAPQTIGLRLNGTALPAQPLKSGWNAYEWALPEGLVLHGTNEAFVIVDRLSTAKAQGSPARGIALTEVRVIHDVQGAKEGDRSP